TNQFMTSPPLKSSRFLKGFRVKTKPLYKKVFAFSPKSDKHFSVANCLNVGGTTERSPKSGDLAPRAD
ncbi:hypothetical protein NPIL_370151, partial [Nephila pilipes]